jgi:serine/threonine-protein kinase
VRRVGDAVRISASLVHAADGSTLWSERYDRPYRDLFALQDEISNAVAGALKAKLSTSAAASAQTDRPPGGNLDAYAAYLQAAFYGARGAEADHNEALARYAKAIEIDPHYARAWAGLSAEWTSYAQQSLEGDAAQQAYAEARKAADKAVQLQPDLAAAYIARATLRRNGDFDWTGAEADARRAVELSPNDGAAKFSLGVSLATFGKPKEAIVLTQQALATNPVRASWQIWLATYYASLGRLDEAEAAVQKALALQADGTAYYELLAIIKVQRGDAQAALAAAEKEPDESWRRMALALARQIGDDRAAADAALQELIDKDAKLASYPIAEVYALRRDPDRMFEWLDRTWENRDPGITSLLTDPFILRYRDDPRFAVFCRKAGFPTATEAIALL